MKGVHYDSPPGLPEVWIFSLVVICGGLNKDGPQTQVFACSVPGGGTVRMCGLDEQVCHCGGGFEVSYAQAISAPSPAPFCLLAAMLLLMTIMD